MQEIGIQTDKERASSPAESMFSMLDSEFINLLSTVDDEHIEEEPGDFEEAILADIDLESFNPIRSKTVSSKRPRFITKSLHFLDLYEVNPNEYPEKSFSFLSNSQEISVGDFIVLERDSKTIILKFLSHIQSEPDDDGGCNRHDEAENGFLVVQIYQPIGQVPLLSQVASGQKGEVVLMNRQTPLYILPSELSNGFQNCAVMVKDARDDKCTADGVDFFFVRFGYSSGCGDANGFSLEALKQIPKKATCTCNICDGLKRREPVNVSVAELSAGCGGFALGAVISTAVENVNFVSKWCCEEDSDSVQACSQNNGVVFQEATGKLIERIRSGTLNMSGTADVLVVNGSTECGDLVLSSVDTLHPTLVVLHSSPQILSPTRSQEIFSLMVNLVKKGYGVRWQVLDSCKYSVPLSQKYFVMFASAPGHSCPQFPMPFLEPTPTLREALDGLPPLSDSDFPFNAIEKTSRYARFLNQFVGQCEFTFNHVSCRLENNGSSSTLNWDEKVENVDTRTNMLKWVHPDSERLFSVRELCRLVSFPDDFRLWGTVESQRMQVSKSFPPLLAKAIFDGVGAWILNSR
ncbi:S-adenosyl-L-methionine-dependent methyltransferase [Obelidium mucronatum]|nr:S-adenosyl-L-methionine-dependent methyltransferase [Obelidium mucronatum]